MANKIQVKRGLKASLPALDIGEPGFCTDTQELFVGSSAGNKRLADGESFDAHMADNAPHGATPNATASKLMVRDVNGRVKVAAPGCSTAGEILNISDALNSAYASLNSCTSAIILPAISVYLISTHTATGANSATSGLYLVQRYGTQTTITTIVAEAGITLTVNGSYNLVCTNSSGGSRGLQVVLIKLNY